MRFRIKFITFSLLISSVSAFSQNTIVEKLQTRKSGEGEVTIHHDSQINSLLGSNSSKTTYRPVKKDADKTTFDQEIGQNSVNTPAERKTIKARGYRIQIYAGNNSRVARNEAFNIANKVKEEFPDIPVYTYFQPPRWLCRVGDFRSIEEADLIMRRIKATGVFKEVSIVKEQINIPID